METLWQAEINITLFVQSLGTWLVYPMKFFTFLGSEEFFMLVFPIIYWCINAKLGIRLGVMLLLSNGINSSLKLAFHSPRPYWFDTRVQPFATETSFGFPSGHAQTTTSLWGLLGISLKPRWFTWVSIAIIICVGLSRIYLGVHFTSDVAAGILFGILTIIVFFLLEKPITSWITRQKTSSQILLILLSSLVYIAIIGISAPFLQTWHIPDIWMNNAVAGGNEAGFNPSSLSDVFTVAGTWFGLFSGLILYQFYYGGFSASGTPRQKLLRYLLGILGVAILWFGLGKVFPRSEDWISYILRFLRYSLVGLWVTLIAPYVFAKFKLTE